MPISFFEHDGHMTATLELPADLETPVSAYLKISKKSPYAFLFESVDQVEKWGRYSFLGADPERLIFGQGRQVVVKEGKREKNFEVENPVDFLRKEMAENAMPEIAKFLPVPFRGGYVGYWGYDGVRHFEALPSTLPERGETPDFFFMKIRSFIVFDNLKQKMILVAHSPTPIQKKSELGKIKKALTGDLCDLVDRLKRPIREEERELKRSRGVAQFSPEFSAEEYGAKVNKIKSYIRAGDAFQVVFSMEFAGKGAYDPLSLYRVLRTVNPSPYLYLLHFDRFSVVGSSPEIMVRKEGDRAVVRPIAGTRKRGADAKEDRALEEELKLDIKENAEHIMLVDLGRNDLGRVSLPGTVKVTAERLVERYSHVMHLVSEVEGRLKPDCDALDLVAATFPAGTLSGAPKVRAMEIIEELEKSRRGIYGGAVGYIGFDGDVDLAIAIRTLVVHPRSVSVRAGAGIVQDSVPKLEYEECCNKARALMRACELLSAKIQK